MCEVLPAVHALTGCDVTSKFRIKSTGIKADPSMYLNDFGKLEVICSRNIVQCREVLSLGLKPWQSWYQNTGQSEVQHVPSAEVNYHT